MLCMGDYGSSLLLTLKTSDAEDHVSNHQHMPDGHQVLIGHEHSEHSAFDNICVFYVAASFDALAAGETFAAALTGLAIMSSVYGYRDPYSVLNYLPRARAPPSSIV